MGKKNKTNVIGQAKSGRPPKQKGVQKTEIVVSDLNQPLFWYQSEEATEIIIILAVKGQILFKCLSGKMKESQQNFPKKSGNRRSSSLTVFRKSRQAFVKEVEKLQSQLLKKLEEHLEIELIGKKKEMNYFFFQDNQEINLAQEPQNIIMKILRPYIHKDFLTTLITLLELQATSKRNQSDLSNIYKHKHFVSWAFIIAWGCEIRDHLKKLQQIRNNEDLTKESLLAKELMQESKQILQQKKQEVNQDIGKLIKDYEKQYQNEIFSIIDQFRYRNQQNNFEFEYNSYLEVN